MQSEQPTRRRWFRIRLRYLLLFLTLFAVGFGSYIRWARAQPVIVRCVQKEGVSVWRLNGTRSVDMKELQQAIQRIIKANPHRTITIVADRKTRMGEINPMIKFMQHTGAEDVQLQIIESPDVE